MLKKVNVNPGFYSMYVHHSNNCRVDLLGVSFNFKVIQFINPLWAFKREPWPCGTALAWYAGGAWFEYPWDQNFVLFPSVTYR